MANPLKTVDTGVAVTPTARAPVFGGGAPGLPVSDYSVETQTATHADCFNPASIYTNPPSATPGSA